MRIVAGKFRGRKLTNCDKLKTLRPTTDKNREALFNILQSAKFLKDLNFSLIDCNFLDLCCGTGAVGLEAISRGAKKVFFVENNRFHLDILQKNIELLKVENQTKILAKNVKNLDYLNENFDVIFLDPPYEEDYQEIVENLLQKKIINPETLLIVEFEAKKFQNFADFFKKNLKIVDERIYGISLFGFYKLNFLKFDL
jgi:16S rRNA (guanine966-N2)-methyltransferase